MSRKFVTALKSVLSRTTTSSGAPQMRDLAAAIRLQPLAANLILPWTSSSMSPSAISVLLNDIEINNRRMVVECGSGISTFFLAKALSTKEGARLMTIDHDEKFLALVRSWVKHSGCDHCVDFVCAPMEKLPGTIGKGDWYDTDAIGLHFESPDSRWWKKTIDMLVVDGPPAWKKGKEQARLPAGLYFKSRLSDSCSVFLDDINREGERKVAATWASALGIRISDLYGNIGHAQRGQGYTIV